jgi:hypothetical protein
MEGNTKMTKIPSDEELNRASKLMEVQFQNLDIVRQNVIRDLEQDFNLYDFRILPESKRKFRAYVFFHSNEQTLKFSKPGFAETIKAKIYEQLELNGRGTRNEISVDFEFDSDENVKANFEGNYLLRLR